MQEDVPNRACSASELDTPSMARLWLKTEILWDMGLSRASRNSSMLENLERDSLGGVALHRVDDQPGPGADGAVVAPTDTDTVT